jgi:hypothetical protein
MKKLLVTIVIGLFLAGVVWAGPPVAPSPCRWTSNGIECDGNRDGTPDLLINKSDGTVEIEGARVGFVEESLGGGQSQTISAFGASELTSDDDSTDETGTLGDGTYVGQTKTIVLTTDGGDDWDITISHHVTSDDEAMTCDAAGEYARFWWDGDDWVTIDATCTFP